MLLFSALLRNKSDTSKKKSRQKVKITFNLEYFYLKLQNVFVENQTSSFK